jgi:3-hydroxyisobutyrate dehydrogenase-like beta-hydroxyacid dehydrogenase
MSERVPNSLHLALIGFGEVGNIFAKGLLAHAGVSLAAYDILFDENRGIEEARAAGVRVASNAADAVEGAAFVISAVTASAALDVARGVAPHLRPGQIFLDINSASPATKRQGAAAIEGAGASFVEAAVMAPVPGPGLRVPILAGGERAAEVAERLNELGMNITPVATEIGRASAMKLCRSIVIKGLEAIMIDCAAASRLSGVEAEVYASLAGTFPSIDWPKLAETMAQRVHQHGRRRAAEMREAADMLTDLGLDPGLCQAIARTQDMNAK